MAIIATNLGPQKAWTHMGVVHGEHAVCEKCGRSTDYEVEGAYDLEGNKKFFCLHHMPEFLAGVGTTQGMSYPNLISFKSNLRWSVGGDHWGLSARPDRREPLISAVHRAWATDEWVELKLKRG